MHQRNMNIYASCRHAAGLTQEAAAELLDCAVRTLAAWEAGTCLPPDDKVMVMCRAYGTPILATEHLRQSSSLAREMLPEIHKRSLAEAVLALLGAIRAFNAAELDWGLIEIAADGEVSPDERRGFDFLLLRLDGIIEASFELKLTKEAIKKPACTEAQTGHIVRCENRNLL